MNAHLAACRGVILEVVLEEDHTSALCVVPPPHPMHLPQVPPASGTILAPGLATLRVEERFTSALCGNREGSRPVVYVSRMARTEEERLQGGG